MATKTAKPKRGKNAKKSIPEDDRDAVAVAFGANVRRLMDAKGMTVKRMCSLTGLSPSNVYYLLVGRVTPTLATMAKVATALGMRLEMVDD